MTALLPLAAAGMLCALSGAAFAAEREFRLELLQGETQTVSLERASESELTLSGSQPRTMPMADVVAFRRDSEPADWPRRTSLVWLSNGDRLVCEPLTADEDLLSVRWLRFAAREELQIPLEHVTAISLRTPPSAALRRKLFRRVVTDPQRNDVAWLANGDRVSGEFTELTTDNGTIHTETGNLSIRREQLAALRFNPQLVNVPKPTSPRFLLSLSDGSRVTVSRFQWTASQLSFTLNSGVEATLPSEALVGCRVFSDQIVPVSDLTPASIRFAPYLGGDWTWQKNRNVLHGPLELRGREFATGLGVHSQTALTYQLGPKDREFRATVGVDDSAEGNGHVVFSLRLDDRDVWRSPGLTGLSDPVDIPPIDLRGGKQLTLLVEFGEFGDVADYADWCDAILLRDR